MKLRFTPRATRDLVEIAEYISERSPTASMHVRAVILNALQDLIPFPEIGRIQKVEGVRKLITGKYSYLIYYTIDRPADEIVILTIQHPARDREYEDA